MTWFLLSKKIIACSYCIKNLFWYSVKFCVKEYISGYCGSASREQTHRIALSLTSIHSLEQKSFAFNTLIRRKFYLLFFNCFISHASRAGKLVSKLIVSHFKNITILQLVLLLLKDQLTEIHTLQNTNVVNIKRLIDKYFFFF